MTRARINGIDVEYDSGETILAVARRYEIDIPTLCHVTGLEPEGGCRLCVVDMEGASRPVAACHTPLAEGSSITTHTSAIERFRRRILQLNVDAYRTEVPAGRATEFSRLLDRYGVDAPAQTKCEHVDSSHPYLRFDPQLCVNCRRCIHACEEVPGGFALQMSGRGADTRLVIGAENQFIGSGCVSCGRCVDVCPTGALTDRDRIDGRPSERQTQSVCGYCGVGCRISIESTGDRVVRIAGVSDASVNRGALCVKGRYAHSYLASADRLTQPLKRFGDQFVPISWSEAADIARRELSRIRTTHGPDAVAAIASARSTNEACYLLQKLFRSNLGTNNVDCCARVCHSSTALALQLVTGTGAASASLADIEKASCIIVAGANPTEAHPVVGARIKRARLNGAKLIVIDPRSIELASYADLHVQLWPGTNVALFNAIAKLLLAAGQIDARYIDQRTENFGQLAEFLEDISLEECATVTRVPLERIAEAARIIGAGPALFVTGLGLSEQMQGTASVMTLCNIAMMTGSIGKPGAGMLPLRGQNNVQGSADMGCMPSQFTGYQSLADPDVRRHFEELWGAIPASTQPGLTIPEMFDAAVDGRLKAMWIMGEDVLQSDPNEKHVRQALESLDFLVVQELFVSETAKLAHLILPAAAAPENEGTFTNGERRVQRVRAAAAAPGEAVADWIGVKRIANAMGAQWDYESPAEVMDEIALAAPRLFGGISYDRLEGDGLQWPCPDDHHPGTATLHATEFIRGKGAFVVQRYSASPEHDQHGEYILITGRRLEHYNVGTMTRRSPQLELVDRDVLEIHPWDAHRESIINGSQVKLKSDWGEIKVQAKLSRRVAPGTLFLTFHFPESHTNRIIGPHVDPMSKCPQYKVTSVRVEVASRAPVVMGVF